MTKHVVSSAQVAHLWAHQAQSNARNSCGSMSFNGDTLYSYSTPIGRIVQSSQGETVALLTSHSYSVTTSGKHMGSAWRAVRHLPHFSVPALGTHGGWHREPSGDMHTANVLHLATVYADYVKRCMHARSRPYSFEYLTDRAQTVADYVQRFNVRTPGTIDTAADIARITARFDRLDVERASPAYKAKQEKREEARQAREQRKRELLRATAAEKLAAWRAGELHTLPYDARVPVSAALRLRGNKVQSSLGAEVPAEDARRGVAFVAECKRRGQEWRRNGETFPIGPFQLDSVTADGTVRAGCHTIAWAEVVLIGEALGVMIDDSGARV